ncbi:MAG: lytic transglycosylase domain-containing protein [Acetobacteraceae bacterium]
MPAGSARRRAHAAIVLAVVAALAGCAGPRGSYESAHRHGNYAPPGPPGDPWGPYISEASLRFGVPQQWIRAVMRQESGGRDDALSSAGAMGLMQVIPSTYATLRASYGLGDDPYEPHDNIMAGTAYIKEMYDRYGAPGFLAAYNAGPNRLDSYLANGTPLPDETVGYLSNIAPRLGSSTALSGPLAVYAGIPSYGAAPYAPAQPPVVLANASPGSCDPDAAYDPSRACAPLPRAPSPYAPIVPVRPVVLASASAASCDPDAAFDPGRPCTPPPRPRAVPIITTPPPTSFGPARPSVQLASLTVGRPTGSWAIQVGAFLNPEAARLAAADARRAAPDLLSAAAVEAPPTTPFGGALLYRARLASLTPETASLACARLSTRGTACMTVPPGG